MGCQCDMHGRGKACHCRTCCLTFSSVSAFDRHLWGWSESGGAHRSPEDSGLVQVRPGVWGRPYDAARLAAEAWRRNDGNHH